MTEKINVSAKTSFNRLHAFLAFVFWVVVGYFLKDIIRCDFEWAPLLIGLLVGIVRMFIINDKYAWQVATLEEIRDIKAMLESGGKKEIEINKEGNL